MWFLQGSQAPFPSSMATAREDMGKMADTLSLSVASIPSTIDTADSGMEDHGTPSPTASTASLDASLLACMQTPRTQTEGKSQAPFSCCDEKVADQMLGASLATQARRSSEAPSTPRCEAEGPLIHRGDGAMAKRAASRCSLGDVNLVEPKELTRVESEAALRFNGKLNHLTEMARAATPARSAAAERSKTPTFGAGTQRSAMRRNSSRSSVAPLRAVTPPKDLTPAGYTSLSPFPVAAFGKASRTPMKPYKSRFDRSPSPDAYTLKPWSPVAEGKCVPGAAIATARREAVKTWQSRTERSPSVGSYEAKPWSVVSEGKPVAGVGPFGREQRLAPWLRTPGRDC